MACCSASAKFNRILDIDYENRCVVAQPGVTNLGITNAVERRGFYYAPDPSTQIACTIGGNVAENSGGVHCLKYGLTTNNVLGVEMVLITGEVIRLGGKHLDAGGYDLLRSSRRLGRPARRRHRGDGAHSCRKPETARALLIGFPTLGAGGRLRGGDHRRRHHPGRHGDDGQAGDRRDRGHSCSRAIRSTSRRS